MIDRIAGKITDRTSKWLEMISGAALTVILILTGCDIVGRIFGRPVPGTYEVVSFAGGLIVGFAVPMSTKLGEQVKIDIVTELLPKNAKAVLQSVTRLLTIALFLILSYALVQLGTDLRGSGELSPVLRLRFYYVAWGMSLAFLGVVIVLIRDEIQMWRAGK
jgi:TRAP-type C4-dicarboxylate transport system permease small subunit